MTDKAAGINTSGTAAADDTAGQAEPGAPSTYSWQKVATIVALLAVCAGIWYYVVTGPWRNATQEGPIADMIRPPVAGHMNGFDVSNASIPKDEIMHGGPPRDGIPAILDPRFESASDTDYLRDDDKILGIEHNGKVKGYPYRILVRHEIANDEIGGLPIMATYCPLCGTGMIFERTYNGKELTFGVSGLLYNSDVLMYDHQTESLWSQLKMEAVSGEMLGTKLKWLDAELMEWSAWKQKYPDSEVLSTDTGFNRSYAGEAYPFYEAQESTMFPVPQNRDELRNKAWVAGVIVDEQPKAYHIASLELLDAPLEDEVGSKKLTVAFDADSRHVTVTDSEGKEIPAVWAYWFAWQAFYPETELYAKEDGMEADQASGNGAQLPLVPQPGI